MTPAAPTPRKTPLTEWHRAHGARVAEVDGWELPVEYGGTEAELRSLNETAGLFDASHLGEIELAGTDAAAIVAAWSGGEANSLEAGDARPRTLADAGTSDDVLACRLGKAHFLLVVAALATDRLFAAARERAAKAKDLAAVNTSSRYALLWLLGPASVEVLQGLTAADVDGLPRGSFTYGEVAGQRTTIVRVGATDRDGVALLVPPQSAPRVWEALLREGEDLGLVPVGTAAMERLRGEPGARLPV